MILPARWEDAAFQYVEYVPVFQHPQLVDHELHDSKESIIMGKL